MSQGRSSQYSTTFVQSRKSKKKKRRVKETIWECLKKEMPEERNKELKRKRKIKEKLCTPEGRKVVLAARMCQLSEDLKVILPRIPRYEQTSPIEKQNGYVNHNLPSETRGWAQINRTFPYPSPKQIAHLSAFPCRIPHPKLSRPLPSRPSNTYRRHPSFQLSP